jgi:hypothetical protein
VGAVLLAILLLLVLRRKRNKKKKLKFPGQRFEQTDDFQEDDFDTLWQYGTSSDIGLEADWLDSSPAGVETVEMESGDLMVREYGLSEPERYSADEVRRPLHERGRRVGLGDRCRRMTPSGNEATEQRSQSSDCCTDTQSLS